MDTCLCSCKDFIHSALGHLLKTLPKEIKSLPKLEKLYLAGVPWFLEHSQKASLTLARFMEATKTPEYMEWTEKVN